MAALIHTWMRDADGGFGRARDFLVNQLETELLPAWQQGRALADRYGLQFMIYEGGTLLLNDGNKYPSLTDFALQFSKSHAAKQVYQAELAAWASVGSGPFAWYSDVGRAGPWGDYGHWKGIDFDPDPRTDALTHYNETMPAWWDEDDRPASTFANGVYRAGTMGKDFLTGTVLADRLYALSGNDILRGHDGPDTLWGGDGDDRIKGGIGRDTINTGAGDDVIVFAHAREGGDRVDDFGASGHDRFALAGAGFDHPLGGLQSGEFQTSAADTALRTGVRLFYDRDDHRLFYDPDGSGAGAATLLAELDAAAAVRAGDISFF